MADKHDNHGGGGHGEDGHKKHKKHHHHGHGDHPEHEEGWIVSFADNCLLQMGFFVILWAMAQGPKGGGDGAGDQAGAAPNTYMLDFAIAVREAFNTPVDMDSKDPQDLPLIERIKERIAHGETTEPGPDGEKKDAQAVRPSAFRDVAGFVEFEDNATELSARAKDAVRELADQLKGTQWVIEVRGHTSTLETFRDVEAARRLSYDRAYATAKALAAAGLDWRQMRISAAGDTDPVQPRARSAVEHASNQRVEIIKTPETLPPDPFAGEGEGR
jgi:chemotaxis protein MotB